MKFRVKITQILEGNVDIEADSGNAALEAADQTYNAKGEELPDMDDIESLQFSIEADDGRLDPEYAACDGCLSAECDICPRDDGSECHGCPCDDCRYDPDSGHRSNYYDSYSVTYTTN